MLKTLIRCSRPSFLVLAPICVLLGVAAAKLDGYNINMLHVSLAIAGAILAHIAVNALNEYEDFKSGLDLITIRTDFSGGSGGLPENPQAMMAVLRLAQGALLLTLLIGLYFMLKVSWLIVPVGLLGILTIVIYTRWLNRLPWLCLLAPGFSFGLLMVVGTDLVLTGSLSLTALALAMIPFFQVNNLLLLNQYPDIDADIQVGRRHFPIVYGVEISSRVFAVMTVTSLLLIMVYTLSGFVPALAALALLPAGLALLAWKGGKTYGKAIGSQPKFMAANVMATLLTPLVLSVATIYVVG